MSGQEAVRCHLCDTKLCTFIITLKWIFASLFCNCYSKRWESSLPSQERAKQRQKRRYIQLYQIIVASTTIWHMWVTGNFYISRGIITKVLISILLGFVYLFNFWYVTQGRREFQVISRAWHLGEERAPYSRIHMPEHVKLVVVVISATQTFALWSSQSEVAWFLVALLHLSSFLFFYTSNFIRLFPRDRNRNNQLIYKIESIFA